MSKDLALRHKMKFWYQHFVKGEDSFEDSLRPVATVATVEQFWSYYQYFKRPNELDEGSYIYLFKDAIQPIWQDPNNEEGGAFILRFQKEKCNKLWEDILLAYIDVDEENIKEINDHYAEIDFWVKDVDDAKILQKSRKWILKAASLTQDCPIQLIHFNRQ